MEKYPLYDSKLGWKFNAIGVIQPAGSYDTYTIEVSDDDGHEERYIIICDIDSEMPLAEYLRSIRPDKPYAIIPDDSPEWLLRFSRAEWRQIESECGCWSIPETYIYLDADPDRY